MINQVLLFCSTIIIYEFIRYTKLIYIIRSNFDIYRKILKLFKFRKVLDSRKEKLLFSYSKSLFIISIKILIILITIIIFMLILNLFFHNFLNLIISILGIIEMSFIFVIYHQLRKKKNAKL